MLRQRKSFRQHRNRKRIFNGSAEHIHTSNMYSRSWWMSFNLLQTTLKSMQSVVGFVQFFAHDSSTGSGRKAEVSDWLFKLSLNRSEQVQRPLLSLNKEQSLREVVGFKRTIQLNRTWPQFHTNFFVPASTVEFGPWQLSPFSRKNYAQFDFKSLAISFRVDTNSRDSCCDYSELPTAVLYYTDTDTHLGSS